jgi:hypothetical protein
MIIGSLAMEMKWQRREIAHIERVLYRPVEESFVKIEDATSVSEMEIGLY